MVESAVVMRARAPRVLAVTAGLTAAGAVLGALCASVITELVLVDAFGVGALWPLMDAPLVGGAVTWGARMGGVALPAITMSLLRHVPLRAVLAALPLGTVGGAMIGEWLAPVGCCDVAFGGDAVLHGAIAGAVVVSLVLRARWGASCRRPPDARAAAER